MFLDEPEVLFGILLDPVQAGFQVLAPGLEFVVGETGLGEGRSRRGLGGQVGALVDDGLDQFLACLGLGTTLAADAHVGAAGRAGSESGWAHDAGVRSCRFQGQAAPRKRSAQRGAKG